MSDYRHDGSRKKSKFISVEIHEEILIHVSNLSAQIDIGEHFCLKHNRLVQAYAFTVNKNNDSIF